MDLRTPARWAGLLGGGCWVARMILGATHSSTGALPTVLFWVGAALLAVALGVGGSELAGDGPRWLRALVAVAFPLLVSSVLEFLHPMGDPQRIDGVLALAVVAWAASGLRRLRAERPPRAAPPRAASTAQGPPPEGPAPQGAPSRGAPRAATPRPQRRREPQRGQRPQRGRRGAHRSRSTRTRTSGSHVR